MKHSAGASVWGACDAVAMSGGFYSAGRPGVPLGVRAGHAEAADARPWEAPARAAIAPRDRHVDVLIAEQWHQGLAISLMRDIDGRSWRVKVAYVLGEVVREEWVSERQVRPRGGR